MGEADGHHLKILARAGVTAEREEGTRKYISLRREELDQRFPGLIESVLRGADAAASHSAEKVASATGR